MIEMVVLTRVDNQRGSNINVFEIEQYNCL